MTVLACKYKSMSVLGISAAVIILSASGCSEDPGQKGIYEYVREADKYMEQDNYDQALYVLHEGYETALDSKEMQDQLVRGYVKYSRFLDDKGELDEAIDKMEMAYEMHDKNALAIHELSYLYAKKAVKYSEEGRAEDALALSIKAVDTAMQSKKVRKNISIYFFNRGVEAFQRNDDPTVLLCLNASYALKKSFMTLDMLARYYYRKGDLNRALFFWKKAKETEPDNADIDGKIEKVRKEIELEAGKRTVETEHFDIQFYGNNNVDVEALARTLDGIYKEVGDDLRFYPPGITPLVFYREDDFREIFKQAGIVRAFYDGAGIRISVNADYNDPLFPGLAAHEYTHAVLSILTNNECPIWLHEGIAVLEQDKYIPSTLMYVFNEIGRGKELSLEYIDGGFSEKEDEERLALSYEAAYTAVLFILDKWGWDGLRGLLDRIGKGTHYANAIDEEFYVSRGGFEKMWNEYLKSDSLYAK
ncbi:MAG: hypothetical protein ABIG55_05445 [Candidatus Omnitrophota bacterium]